MILRMSRSLWTEADFLQILLYLIVLVAATPLLGAFMARVYQGEKHLLKPCLGWLERLFYKSSLIDPEKEMDWKEYTRSLLVFNLAGLVLLLVIQLCQASLPLNPQ